MRWVTSSEKLRWLIFIVIHFWIAKVYGADSLRIGLMVRPSHLFDVAGMENRLAVAIAQHTPLKVIAVDSMNVGIIDSGQLSDDAKKWLIDQRLFGLLLCDIEEDSLVTIILASTNGSRIYQLVPIAFETMNDPESLSRFARSVNKFFEIQKQFPGRFGIFVARIGESLRDPEADKFMQVLMDSLTSLTKNPLFANIELIPEQSNLLEGGELQIRLLEKIGDGYSAAIVLSGMMKRVPGSQQLLYSPYFLIPKTKTQLRSWSNEQSILQGKICRLRRFDLPAISLNDVSSVVDFLKGYFLLTAKQYAEAAEQFRKFRSFASDFHLAECYWYQGTQLDRDTSLTRTDRQNAVRLWQHALSFASDRYDSARTLNNIGAIFQINRHRDSTMIYYRRAYSLRADVNDHEDFIRIAQNLGNGYLMMGQWNQALDIFQSTIEAMKQANDSLNLATTYENLGQIYQLLYQGKKATEYYQKALELHKKLNDEAGVANALMLLGNVHQENKEYLMAIDYFRQCLDLSLKNHHEPKLAEGYDHLGLAFQQLGNLDSALIYFQKSYDLYHMLGNKSGILQTLLHQAAVWQKQKLADRAIHCYEQALESLGENNSIATKAQIYDRLGDVYNQQNNLIPAFDYYRQAASLYEQSGNFELLALVLFNMGLIELKQNDYSQGYQLLKKAIAIDQKHGFNNLEREKIFLDQIESMLKQN